MSYSFPHAWERDSFRVYRGDPEVCGMRTKEFVCRRPMDVKVLPDGTVVARCPSCDGGGS